MSELDRLTAIREKAFVAVQDAVVKVMQLANQPAELAAKKKEKAELQAAFEQAARELTAFKEKQSAAGKPASQSATTKPTTQSVLFSPAARSALSGPTTSTLPVPVSQGSSPTASAFSPEMANLKLRFEQTQSELAKKEAELASATNALSNANEQVRSLRAEFGALQNKADSVDMLEEQLERLKLPGNDAVAELRTLNSQIEALRGFERKFAETEADRNRLKVELGAQAAKNAESLRDLTQKLSDVAQVCDQLKVELSIAQANASVSATDIGNLQAEIDVLTNALTTERTGRKLDLDLATQQYEAKIAALQNTLHKNSAENNTISSSAQTAITNFVNRDKTKTELIANYEADNARLKARLAEVDTDNAAKEKLKIESANAEAERERLLEAQNALAKKLADEAKGVALQREELARAAEETRVEEEAVRAEGIRVAQQKASENARLQASQPPASTEPRRSARNKDGAAPTALPSTSDTPGAGSSSSTSGDKPPPTTSNPSGVGQSSASTSSASPIIIIPVLSDGRIYRLTGGAVKKDPKTPEPPKNSTGTIDTMKFYAELVETANKLAGSDAFSLSPTSDALQASIQFSATTENVKQFVYALTNDLLRLWGHFTDPAQNYWVYTAVPLLTALAIAIKNQSLDSNLTDTLLSEVLFVIAVGLCGHQNSVNANLTDNLAYDAAVYSKFENPNNYVADSVIKTLMGQVNSNYYGRLFPYILETTLYRGRPVPLLQMALDLAATHDGEPLSSDMTAVTLDGGALKYTLPTTTSVFTSADTLVSIFGMPVLQALLSTKVAGELTLYVPDLSTVSEDNGSYTQLTGDIITKFIVPYSTVFQTYGYPLSVGNGRVQVLPIRGNRKVNVVKTQVDDGQGGLKEIAVEDIFYEIAETKFPDSFKDGTPAIKQLTYAVDVPTTVLDNVSKNNARLAFVNFLYEFASIEEIWISHRPTFAKKIKQKYDPAAWLEMRTAWAYKLAGSVLFTPIQFKDEPAKDARSFFQRLAVTSRPPEKLQTKVRVFGVNDYDEDEDYSPTTIDSAISLRPRFTLGTLLKRLSSDKENSADITLYRNVLKGDGELTELFSSTDMLTVLVPSNAAIGYFEGEKALEYRSLPANERSQMNEGAYVKKALADALRYYMFDGDVSFASKSGETVVLASKKTDANGVSLRLYVTVDAKFNSEKGGFVMLSGALDGTRPVRARLTGRVLSKTGRYYVIDYIVGPSAAERRASEPGYVAAPVFLPPPPTDRDVSTYAQIQLNPPDQYQALPASALQKSATLARAGETVVSACRDDLLLALEESDRENRLDFEAFYESMPETAKKVLATAISAQRALHIYVPARKVLKAAAAGLSADALTPILLAHVGLNTYRIVQSGLQGEGPFDRSFLMRLIDGKRPVVVPALQDNRSFLLGVGSAPDTTQVQLVAGDFIDRTSVYTYKPFVKSTAQSTFYRTNPIYVHFVNRVLLPGTAVSAAAPPTAAVPQASVSSSETRTLVSLAVPAPLAEQWVARINATEQSLRNETDGDRLIAHVRTLDADLTELGGASALTELYSTADLGRQRSQLEAAISQNDNFNEEAAASADARAAVKDLYDRF